MPNWRTTDYNLSRMSVIVSILALITSIASPIVTYYWFEGEFRIHELKVRSFAVEGSIEVWRDLCEDKNSKTAKYFVQIENSGDLAIDKIKFTVQQFSKNQLNANDITTVPPIGFKMEDDKRGRLVLNFDEALPPHTSVTLWLGERDNFNSVAATEQFAPSVWLTSEVSGKYVKWNTDDDEDGERMVPCPEYEGHYDKDRSDNQRL